MSTVSKFFLMGFLFVSSQASSVGRKESDQSIANDPDLASFAEWLIRRGIDHTKVRFPLLAYVFAAEEEFPGFAGK